MQKRTETDIPPELQLRLLEKEAEIEKRYGKIIALYPFEKIERQWKLSKDFKPFMSLIHSLNGRVSALNLNKPRQAIMNMMLDAIDEHDHMTGFDKGFFKELDRQLFDYYQLIAQKPGNERMHVPSAYYAACDIANLGGVNAHLISLLREQHITEGAFDGLDAEATKKLEREIDKYAMKVANKLLGTIANIFRVYATDTLTLGGIKHSVEFYRDGGDELSAMILLQTNPKTPSLGKRTKGMLMGAQNPGQVDIWDDEETIDSKLNRGMRNARDEVHQLICSLGLARIPHPKHPNPPESIARHGVGLSASVGYYDPSASFEQLERALESDIAQQRSKKNQPLRASSRNVSFAEFEWKLDQYRLLFSHPQDTEIFPFHDEPMRREVADHDRWLRPHEKRKRQTEHSAERVTMGKAATEVLMQIHDLYESPDPLTGFRKGAFYGEVASAMEHLTKFTTVEMYGVQIDIQNFAGMNDAFDHVGCDKHFEAISDIVADILIQSNIVNEKTDLLRPNAAGSKISFITENVSQDRLTAVLRTVDDAVLDYAHTHDELFKLYNPKHKNADGSDKYGVESLTTHVRLPVLAQGTTVSEATIDYLEAFDAAVAHKKQENGYLVTSSLVSSKISAERERKRLDSSNEFIPRC